MSGPAGEDRERCADATLPRVFTHPPRTHGWSASSARSQDSRPRASCLGSLAQRNATQRVPAFRISWLSPPFDFSFSQLRSGSTASSSVNRTSFLAGRWKVDSCASALARIRWLLCAKEGLPGLGHRGEPLATLRRRLFHQQTQVKRWSYGGSF